ncbi:hypothetical protein ACOSQ4_022836 [Xanthoceras sorbifolium]
MKILSYRRDFTIIKKFIYGDNDLVVPNISTENWISTLNLTVDEDWRAWFVDGQIAVYYLLFLKNYY